MNLVSNNISVVIPTLNRAESLRRTICTLCAGSVLPKEIIVVDQSDELIFDKNRATLDAQLIPFKHIRLETRSSTISRNMGLAINECKFCILSDDDIDFDVDVIKNLQVIIQRDSRIGLVGFNVSVPFTRNDNPLMNIAGLIALRTTWGNRAKVRSSIFGVSPKRWRAEIEADWALGGACMINAEYAKKNNIQFDEAFTGYGYAEDLEFSMRLAKAAKAEGLKCLWTDQVRVLHLISSEWRVPSRMHDFAFVINRAYILDKHFHGLRKFFAWACYFWSNIGEVVFRAVSGRSIRVLLEANWYLINNAKKVFGGNLLPK